ncbi:CpaF family protein [Bdellovibrio sp. HCB2-146]|uniref:CpaF family protein n=1 Tax=Bdellovibrio sp. HCB2-146 TaxID=3394362 RepID=UPI0039BC700E
MNLSAQDTYNRIQELIQKLPLNEFSFAGEDNQGLHSQKIENLIKTETESLEPALRDRVRHEFQSWGPLQTLLLDEDITEILVNGPSAIWYEKNGRLRPHNDYFYSDLSYRNCLERICQTSRVHITIEHPCADGKFLDFRLSLIGHDLTHSNVHLSLRRHPKNPWTFAKLAENSWCEGKEIEIFQKIIKDRKNFLVVGSTGAGKTSVLNSFLNLLPSDERVLVIEDTPEIVLPNSASMKLLTREDPQGILPSVDQTQLVKRSLRLRPDRLVMGEVRGSEAKDFLMALATGHSGSFGTLHAQDAHQALIRLEMLIQMGAPQWSLEAIRRLIQLSLDYIIVAEKTSSGLRRLKGIYRITSLENHGFLLDKLGDH